MATVTMTMEEYLQLINGLTFDLGGELGSPDSMDSAAARMPKKKRSTAYQRRYSSNFKKIANRYKLKSGKWKKGGFKAAVKLAHKMSKK